MTTHRDYCERCNTAHRGVDCPPPRVLSGERLAELVKWHEDTGRDHLAAFGRKDHPVVLVSAETAAALRMMIKARALCDQVERAYLDRATCEYDGPGSVGVGQIRAILGAEPGREQGGGDE